MRIALYGRVSRNDGAQDASNQLLELRGWQSESVARLSKSSWIRPAAGTGGAGRPLERALEGAHRRRFDLLLIWSLDRLSRGGIETTIGLLRRLQASGVIVRSLRESWLNTSDPHVAELLISVMSWLAQQEREQLIARTKAGMARARRQGVHRACRHERHVRRRRALMELRVQRAAKFTTGETLAPHRPKGGNCPTSQAANFTPYQAECCSSATPVAVTQ
jgi:DNA invertase Pin-like site-specific DNA recombinase